MKQNKKPLPPLTHALSLVFSTPNPRRDQRATEAYVDVNGCAGLLDDRGATTMSRENSALWARLILEQQGWEFGADWARRCSK